MSTRRAWAQHASWRVPRLWSGPIAPRGRKHRALTLTESMEPVDHRTTGLDIESELELREGPPYGESNILWTGGKRNALKTETMRRELEQSFSLTKPFSEPVESPTDARQMMERQWESVATSTSGRGVIVSRSRGRRRSHSKAPEAEGSGYPEADGGAPILVRTRRRSAKGIASAAKRMSVLIGLERVLQKAIRTRERSRRDTAVGMFLGNLVYVPLLSRTQEGVLASFINAGHNLQKKKDKLKERLRREPTRQELAGALGLQPEDVERIFNDKRRAKDLLIQFNLRMVVSIARRYRNKGEELADLYLEGVRGLEHATELFDFKKGHKFSTYAYYWIRQAVSRCISNQSRVIRLPVHVCEALTKINRVTQDLSGDGPVTDSAIAESLGLTEDKVALYKKAALPIRSLDAPLFTNRNKRMEQDLSLLVDNLAEEERQAEDSLKDNMLKENLNVVLNTLHPRERNVLRMRYGLNRPGGESMKLCDISDAYGLSSERIRQIEENALRKMRRPWRKSLLMMP